MKLFKTYPAGVGDDHSLLLVIGGGDTLEDTEALGQRDETALGSVGNHTTNGTPENLGGGTEMEWTTLGVNVAP